jgi:hypothetical protein
MSGIFFLKIVQEIKIYILFGINYIPTIQVIPSLACIYCAMTGVSSPTRLELFRSVPFTADDGRRARRRVMENMSGESKHVLRIDGADRSRIDSRSRNFLSIVAKRLLCRQFARRICRDDDLVKWNRRLRQMAREVL